MQLNNEVHAMHAEDSDANRKGRMDGWMDGHYQI